VHALALDVGSGGFPNLDRLGVVAKIDADFLENGIGIVLEQRQPFFGENLVVGNLAGDVGDR